MSDSLSLRAALVPVIALLSGTALLTLGHGLQTSLVPLRAAAEGFGPLTIGLLGATYYAGFVVGCLLVPVLIQRAGHIRAFAAMLSCVSAAALAFPLLVGEVQWVVVRFLFGVCISGVLVIVESWLNARATPSTRGAVMSAYVVVTYFGLTVGQLGVTLQPIEGFALFSLCSILLSIAAVPVVLTRTEQPPPIPRVRFRPKRLWSLAPTAFVGILLAGITVGALLSLAAVFAVDLGLSTKEAATFAALIVLGGAIGQYPFGRASDFVDRRVVLLVAALLSGVAAIALALFAGSGPTMLYALAFTIGLVCLPLYALAAAHAYDWSDPDDLVETSAGMNLLFGVGSTLGPLLASAAIATVGAVALPLYLAAAFFALALYTLYRITRRERPDDALRADFDVYATAPVGSAAPSDVPAAPSDAPAAPSDVPAAPSDVPAAASDGPAAASDAPAAPVETSRSDTTTV
ncbi:MAG: MFS transporter [Pseudomonadota bacterium]